MRAPSFALALGFVGAVAAPLVDAALRRGPANTQLEFRVPAPTPRTPRSLDDALEWPRKFDAWYGDHFGLRESLLRTHNAVLWNVFRTSPTDKFLLGRDEWVFTTDARAVDVGRGALPCPRRRVEGLRRMIDARRAWLAARGIEYLFVVAPNKDQVYGELLPAAFASVGPTWIDQLVAEQRAHGSPELLDLRAALRAERAHDGERGVDDWTYYRLGTHWSDRGAFAAYRAIVARLAQRFPDLAPLAREDFEVAARGVGDSLAAQLYLEDALRQTAWRWKLGPRRRARYDDAAAEAEGGLETSVDAPAAPRALVLHDSFGTQVRTMLAEHFSSASFVWAWDFDPQVIEEHRPAVVIELFVDRSLYNNPAELGVLAEPDAARTLFDASEVVLLALDGTRDAERIGAWGRSVLDATDAGLRVRGRNAPPAIVLPAIDAPPRARLSVRMEVECDAQGGADLNYTKRGEPEFERRNGTFVPLRRGLQTVFVEVLDEGLAGPSLLRFLPPARACVLRAFEIRAQVD